MFGPEYGEIRQVWLQIVPMLEDLVRELLQVLLTGDWDDVAEVISIDVSGLLDIVHDTWKLLFFGR